MRIRRNTLLLMNYQPLNRSARPGRRASEGSRSAELSRSGRIGQPNDIAPAVVLLAPPNPARLRVKPFTSQVDRVEILHYE